MRSSSRGFWLYVLTMSMLGVAAGISATQEQVWHSTVRQVGGPAVHQGAIFSGAMILVAVFAVWKLISSWRES